MDLSRRDLLGLGVLGTAAFVLPVERTVRAADQASLIRLPRPYEQPFRRPPDIDLRAAPGRPAATRLGLTTRQLDLQVLGPAGTQPATPWWAYVGPRGEVNPTIHVDKGQPLELSVVNRLPARHPQFGYESWNCVHLHGSASLPQYDGYASDVIRVGQGKVYRFPNAQGARTLWYHDHTVHRTATNAYSGLAAQYHIHDEMETGSGIPTGPYDVPLTIRDGLFRRDGRLLYDDQGQSSLMGDVVLVNGVPWPVMDVARRRYRFRFLNASLSRSFRISLSDPRARMWVVATDGGFVPSPIPVEDFRFGMGERYEVVVDFSQVPAGTAVEVRGGALPNNVEYLHTRKVMRFRVTDVPYTQAWPDGTGVPRPNNEPMERVAFYAPRAPDAGVGYLGPDEVMGLTEAMAVRRRRMRFGRHNGLWVVNDTTWDDVVRSGYQKVVADPGLGDIEVWDLETEGGGWFHPIHLHLVDFRMLSRNGRPVLPYEAGPKDTAYVGEGEVVRVAMKFGPHEGRYMIHCHNIVHEDHDMMAQFRVGPPRGDFPDDPNDPIGAHPASDDGDTSDDYDTD